MEYCVLTLDLVSSRQLTDRHSVQEDLKDILKNINHKYRDFLKVPFDFTLGDEVQGVLLNLTSSYLLVRDFQFLLKNQLFYAGVGYGGITTELSTRSGAMDGPAFHFARESVEFLKEKYSRVSRQSQERRFAPLVYYSLPSKEFTTIVNNYLLMIELLKYKLTAKQREVYWLLFETDTYREIADLLMQSKSAVTQKVQSGHLEEIRLGEEGLLRLLQTVEKNYAESGWKHV